jgi:hypothetical protein
MNYSITRISLVFQAGTVLNLKIELSNAVENGENGARHSLIHLLKIKTSSVIMEITGGVFLWEENRG